MNVKLYGVWVLKELLLSIYFRLLAACRLEESLPLVLSSSRLWERTAVLPTCGKLISTDLADMLLIGTDMQYAVLVVSMSTKGHRVSQINASRGPTNNKN